MDSSRAFPPRADARIVGVGIDVVGIARLSEMLERTPALLDRLLTPGERRLSPASRAARVAAKEAVGKALGSPGDYSWQDVTVERTEAGRPYPVLSGAALASAESRGVAHLHLSLSHDADIATAVVVAERTAESTAAEKTADESAAVESTAAESTAAESTEESS
ncbi:holo-ACP synthase [Brachybacterium sp. JHP9]|uniref:Holo-[acyl-carrier-protein] synthase n=1 Tax=Brachybacterium equifaecis TaxID=2910770 RepID=A0ABT0QYL2_9MICO|nr:holo-ACP synthase [Brachybacterium equifaecis]MCL6422746.1 holo-ACP synthase [Brachybacterium equifaecis]